jgi:hypothetical protein
MSRKEATLSLIATIVIILAASIVIALRLVAVDKDLPMSSYIIQNLK